MSRCNPCIHCMGVQDQFFEHYLDSINYSAVTCDSSEGHIALGECFNCSDGINSWLLLLPRQSSSFNNAFVFATVHSCVIQLSKTLEV